jgi:hypothetical protein
VKNKTAPEAYWAPLAAYSDEELAEAALAAPRKRLVQRRGTLRHVGSRRAPKETLQCKPTPETSRNAKPR